MGGAGAPRDQGMLPLPGQRAELGPAGHDRKRFAHVVGGQQLTVSQAAEMIKTVLETRLPSPMRIVGEVSNLKANNHWYFSLKDEASVLSCVAWATAVRGFGFTPKDGDQVVATGHISHYGAQGRTQLYVNELAPVGAGALEMRFRALCEELRGLGYFDEARKKPLPMFPRRIAVITSATGAAVQDVIHTAAQRCKAVGLHIVDVRVQGDGAAAQVAKAIKWVDRHRARMGVDAILVTRGGGSIEDLWVFNERIVAEAVFKCALPVVAAIGHESDTTIIELVADVRASTPTQAALRLVPSSQELCKHIEHVSQRLGFTVARLVQHQRHHLKRLQGDLRRIISNDAAHRRARLERLWTRLGELQPRTLLAQRQVRLAAQAERLGRAMHRRALDEQLRTRREVDGLARAAQRHVKLQRDRLRGVEQRLNAMDPHGVLRRGYSITMANSGEVIRSADAVHAGQKIVTRVADGSFDSVVGARSQPHKSNGQSRSGKRNSGKRNKADSADQLNLFAKP
jgi:exodeoxyribonuclease VII large subunit